MLKRYGITEANTSTTPADIMLSWLRMTMSAKKMIQSVPINRCELVYIAMATCPDIAHAVGVVPKLAHFTAVKRILRNLKGTI